MADKSPRNAKKAPAKSLKEKRAEKRTQPEPFIKPRKR